jgi:large subunit ribosomal protein L31
MSRLALQLSPVFMKQGIHADNYRPVVFQDISNGKTFLTRSTAKTDETIKVEGVEYPLVRIHISSASHPFFTGQEKLLDVEGRVDKFKARTKAAEEARAKAANKAKKTPSKSEKSKEAPQKLGK